MCMCPGGKCPGGKCPRGICPWGECPEGTCLGGLCPRTNRHFHRNLKGLDTHVYLGVLTGHRDFLLW